MSALALAIARSWPYRALLAFTGLFPLLSAIVWLSTAFIYHIRRERHVDSSFYDVPEDELPFVSVIVPAYFEGRTIARTLSGVLRIDYPRLEVVVVNDGSTDGTVAAVLPFLSDPRVRLVDKHVNEGKAMALDDALPLLNGELVMVVDGDAIPEPDALRWMVPHFVRGPRVAAVTGNPRVRNQESLLAKIQTVEFSSIVSLLKRAQVVWGRVMTVSGVIGVYRKSAIEDVGLFVHDAATEDISTSWNLQRRFYDVRYEPRALVRMQVPPTLRALWTQRLRWARGLAQVLRRNADIWTDWRSRRLYPVYVEATLSIVWAYCLVALVTLWAATSLAGAPVITASPVPSWWGMLIASMSLVQLACGVLMDRRYDPDVTRYLPWASLFPLLYWAQMALIAVLATPGGLLHPAGPGTWRTPRVND